MLLTAYQWTILWFFFVLYSLIVVQCRTVPGPESSGVTRAWAEWSYWSPCSRTCGGGVRSRTRVCRTRIPRYSFRLDTCTGDSAQYEICSSKACDSHNVNFLEYQCSLRNNQMIGGKKTEKWIAHQHGRNSCELQCRGTNSSVAYSFGKVIDGTPCRNSDQRAICVNGRCMTVDCTGLIGADNRADKCGVCRGNNSTCIHNLGTVPGKSRTKPFHYEKRGKHFDYNDIFSLPIGATNVLITEDSHKNYLVLMDQRGNYLLNSNWRVQSPGRFIFEGEDFTYNRTWDGIDTLQTVGPTKSTYRILVLGTGNIPPVHYDYWISTLHQNQTPQYSFSNNYDKTIESNQKKNAILSTSYAIVPLSENLVQQPVIKSHGYNSYYHRNEILKSVPSWSLKRHRSTKNDLRLDTEVKTLANTNETTDGKTSRHNKQVRHKVSFSEDRHLPKVFISQDSSITKVASNDYRRPNGTSALSRPGREHVRKYDEKNVEFLRNESKVRKSEIRRRKSHVHHDTRRVQRAHNQDKKSNNGHCSPCVKAKHQTRNFCSSEFVLQVIVLGSEKHEDNIQYDLEVVRSYKNLVPILSREYVWTMGSCLCPKLRMGKKYIVMGYTSMVRGRRESRLVLDPTSFVRQFSEKRDRAILKLVRNRTTMCKKFQLSS